MHVTGGDPMMSVSLLLNLTAFVLAGYGGFTARPEERGAKIVALAVALMALSRIVLL
jgi:hypothetical protein